MVKEYFINQFFPVDVNLDCIDSAFDIFHIEYNKSAPDSDKLDRTNLLDLPVQRFKARSVFYGSGNEYYVLFDKNTISLNELRALYLSEYPQLIIRKLDIHDKLLSKQHYCVLVNLLIRMLQSFNEGEWAYNNLSGKFLVYCPWITSRSSLALNERCVFLSVGFDKNMYMPLQVLTYRHPRNDKEKSYSLYINDPSTHVFRRVLKFEKDNFKPADCFIRGGFAKIKNLSEKKSMIPWFSYGNIREWRKCKLGILHNAITMIESFLQQYFTLEQQKRKMSVYEAGLLRKQIMDMEETKYFRLFADRTINIVDLCCETSSDDLIYELSALLVDKFQLNVTRCNMPVSGCFNVCVVHNNAYYADDKEIDPYPSVYETNDAIMQHITVENFDVNKTAVRKLLDELLIKEELANRKICNLFNWADFSQGKIWNFVVGEKIKDEENNCEYCVCDTLKILPDGQLVVRSFSSADCDTDVFDMFIADKFLSSSQDGYNLEFICYTDTDNLMYVFNTPERLMPNVKNINKTLARLVDGKIKSSVLYRNINDFLSIYPDLSAEYADLLNYIKYSGDEIRLTDDDFVKLHKQLGSKDIFNFRSKFGRLFSDFMRSKDIFLCSYIKNVTHYDNEYDFSVVENILYSTDGENNFYYSVGNARPNLELETSFPVRMVLGKNVSEFEGLLPLLDVGFVRINQFTVQPFPVKYLYEARRLRKIIGCKNCQ